MIYFDSSALVNRYVREDGSDAVRSLIKQGEGIATSKLTYPEILSAFGRKHRTGELGRGLFGGLLDQFEADWKTAFVIELHDELLPTVKLLLTKYPLKGADTVHLSSALWLKWAAKADVTFVASDTNLLKAARGEGLKVINPQ
ncbi:MAG: type II toxin-antitoxin system VapC family toxin [Deltaproteobacteria bacterium]